MSSQTSCYTLLSFRNVVLNESRIKILKRYSGSNNMIAHNMVVHLIKYYIPRS